MSDIEESEFSIEEVEAPADTDPKVLKQVVGTERQSSMAGRIIGGITIMLGFVVTIIGVTGTVDWSFEALGMSSQIQTSVVGVVFVVAGVLVIVLTRPKIKLTSSSNGKDSA